MKIDQGTRDFTFCRSIAAHIEALLSQYREVDQGDDDPKIHKKLKMKSLANRTTQDLNTFCKSCKLTNLKIKTAKVHWEGTDLRVPWKRDLVASLGQEVYFLSKLLVNSKPFVTQRARK